MNTELLLTYLAATHNLDKLMDEAEAWEAEQRAIERAEQDREHGHGRWSDRDGATGMLKRGEI